MTKICEIGNRCTTNVTKTRETGDRCCLLCLQNLVPRNHGEQNGTHHEALTEEQKQKMAAEDDDDDDPESLISKAFSVSAFLYMPQFVALT